ncbi:MAG: tRNA lysidine(34) synthetase TilS [Candidatus Hydrogenedentota bacterium]|nr:MAG: tRNA lysidine(34) synthetase TilS [Candidatus Hydrogenedentota bacterium]
MPTTLRKIVEQTIERHRMLVAGDKVLVALSGGPDSVCLLEMLEELQPRYSLILCVAHFNHKLRGEAAEQDAVFAEQVALRKGLAFVSSSADVRAFAKEEKLSVEAAGRRLRYEFLLRSALSLGAHRVAMGHTADDQVETVLMRFIRGSGPEGLAGIPPVRPLSNLGQVRIIRPLINLWRNDIMRYVRTRKLRYRRDESNESPEYLRNKIRLELLPQLRNEYNPQIKQRLANAASALALDNDFFESEAKLLIDEMVLERKPYWVVFDAGLVATLHPALRKRIISGLVYLANPDAPMLEASHYGDAEILLCAAGGKLDLPGKLRLEISGGTGLVSGIGRRARPPQEAFDVAIGEMTAIPPLSIVVKTKLMAGISSPSRLTKLCNPNRQYFDLGAVRLPLEIRGRRAGDWFKPLGTRGSKKLKDFFIDKKVPRFLRGHVPLLLSNGKIMWVMGYGIDRRFMLKPSSKSALRVDYEKRTFTGASEQGSDF